MTNRILGHFAFLQFTQAFWSLSQQERLAFSGDFRQDLLAFSPHEHVYQVFPLRADCDILIWSSITVEDEASVETFFTGFARLLGRTRQYIQPVNIWWGFTRPSDYARGKSAQEIDPFDDQRKRCLTVYPFTKTVGWYQLSRDARQGMMNEHIRIGHQYPQIKQLLLYSTGLQDQEFVVVYEMDSFAEFSTLVTDLRSSDARAYTERDTPIYAAIYHPAQETLGLFG